MVCYLTYGLTFTDRVVFVTDRLVTDRLTTSEKVNVAPLSSSAVLYHTKVFGLLDVPPPQYLPNLKSPGWLHKDDTPRNYQENTQKTKKGRNHTPKILINVSNNASKHDINSTTRTWNSWISLKCLPLSFLAGFAKCGTTDMYQRLQKHPDMVGSCTKEPHFFNHLPDMYKTGERVPFGEYIECYKELSETYTTWYHSKETATAPNVISMDGSALIIWRPLPSGGYTRYSHRDQRYIIRHLIPQAKFVVMMRDPVTRTYSDYNYRFKLGNAQNTNSTHNITRSPAMFHEIVTVFIKQYTTCRISHSQQECIERTERDMTFNGRVYAFCPTADFYAYHIKKWLDVFPREQFLFLKYEDYTKDMLSTLKKVTQFLGIDHTSEVLRQLAGKRKYIFNKGRPRRPMYNATRTLLQKFYRPHNKELADLLNDKRFLWSRS